MRKGLIIHDERKALALLVNPPHYPKRYDLELRDPRQGLSQQRIWKLQRDGFAFVMLPLTLPMMNSLFIADWIHRLQSTTRLILISGTNADPNDVGRLFDAFLKPKCTATEVALALQCRVRRLESRHEIDEAIKRLLATASCFRRSTFELYLGHSHTLSHLEVLTRQAATDPKAAKILQESGIVVQVEGDFVMHKDEQSVELAPKSMRSVVVNQKRIRANSIGFVADNVKATKVTGQRITKKGLDKDDLSALVQQLETLLREMRKRTNKRTKETTTLRLHERAIAAVGEAQEAAESNDKAGVMTHLKRAGKWAFDVATEIGTDVAAAAVKNSLGLP